MRSAYKILVRKSQVTETLGRPGLDQEHNIAMYLD
jgi:hypothetical protein